MDTNMIVWILFIAALCFLGFFFRKRVKEMQTKRKEAMKEYEAKKEKYTYLKPGALDSCPREDVTAAALFHCMRKENDDFDHYFESMNDSEKTVYGIYMVSSSLEGKNASLHSFFLSPASQPYIPIIVDIFEKVGAHEIADLMKAARRFAEIIANDEDDDEDDPEMGDYSRYNFSDFTNEFVTLVSTTNLPEKLTQFVLEHKEDFYDRDIPEEIHEGDENDEERISDEI